MDVRKLDWDSEFFGLRIGRTVVSTAEDTIALAGQKEMLKEVIKN